MPYRSPPKVTAEHYTIAQQLLDELFDGKLLDSREAHLAQALSNLEHRAAVHGYRAGSIAARRAMYAELGRAIARDATGWNQ